MRLSPSRRTGILGLIPGLLVCGAIGFAVAFAASTTRGPGVRDESESQSGGPASTPRNIILLIGDGMGPQQVGLLFDWAEASNNTPTAIETLMQSGEIGIVRTGASDSPLTDSASSATAIATGVRTYNGAIGVGPDGERLETIIEKAGARGRKTGLVTTTSVTHATPASFAAHIDRRSKEAEIAQQLVASSVDVILGGGRSYFLSERHDLRPQIEAAGWRLVTDEAALNALVPGGRVLGLFANGHLPYLIDRDSPDETEAPTLAELTAKALQLLSDEDDAEGFVLMIEGGRIDHGGHANDVASVLGEMREFDRTVDVVLSYQEQFPDTLVLVTADHETGGLCVTAGRRGLSHQDFLDMASAESSAEVLVPEGKLPGTLKPEPFGVGRVDFYPQSARPLTFGGISRSAGWNVSFGSQGHSTTPVYAIARGPGAHRFAGLLDHPAVGQRLIELLGE